MNIDLGPIILAFAAYYSVLALLIVSLFSLAVWGTVKYVKRASVRQRKPNKFTRGFNKGQDIMYPPTPLAT